MSASFEELTGAVDRLLHTLQYDRHTIAAYHRFWNRLSEFMAHEGILEFNRECRGTVLLPNLRHHISRAIQKLPRGFRHCHRAITVLLDYQNSGTIYRRRLSKDHTFDESFQPAIGEFMAFVDGSMARTSRRQIRSRMESFLGSLQNGAVRILQNLIGRQSLITGKAVPMSAALTQVCDAYVLRKVL